MEIHIPTPLRSYTGGRSRAEAEGATLAELLVDLDRRHPGIRFRMIDERGNIRPHMRIFVNRETVKDMATAVGEHDEVVIMQALSGG